ncbi:MAG: LD-carboxypeptidase [Crocinitomicaceae bacterium]|nr:LD-carboxypeptidase [Crocinitomicaceae bacterium]
MNASSPLIKMPAPLQLGDRVLLAAPARFVTEEQVESAKKFIQDAGFLAVIPEGLLAREGQFGGNDAHRAQSMNDGFASDDIKAIWVMRGGYGCARILPLLDQRTFCDNPTWIIGFSDVTALHGWANRLGVATLHAPVVNTFASCSAEEQCAFWQTLRTPHEESHESHVVGGNLSVLFSLMGTPFFPNCAGNWLLIEDLDEYLYHVDRMLLAFRLAGVLDEVKGVLVGSFTDLHDNTIANGQSTDNPFGQSIEQIIGTHVPESKAVHWNMPVGHGSKNTPIILGASWEQQKHRITRGMP